MVPSFWSGAGWGGWVPFTDYGLEAEATEVEEEVGAGGELSLLRVQMLLEQ